MPTSLRVCALCLAILCSGKSFYFSRLYDIIAYTFSNPSHGTSAGFSLAQDVYIGPSSYVEYANAGPLLAGADSLLFVRFRACRESGPLLVVSRDQQTSLVVSVIDRDISISCLTKNGFVNVSKLTYLWWDKLQLISPLSPASLPTRSPRMAQSLYRECGTT